MFIQTQNPFSELGRIPEMPMNYYLPQEKKSSNVWKWVVGIASLVGGIGYLIWWKNKNDKAEQEKIEEEKAKENELNQAKSLNHI